jgi:hypothetical protein
MTNIAPAVNALLINHCAEFNIDPRIAAEPRLSFLVKTSSDLGIRLMLQTASFLVYIEHHNIGKLDLAESIGSHAH